jgi:hypothetical protein
MFPHAGVPQAVEVMHSDQLPPEQVRVPDSPPHEHWRPEEMHSPKVPLRLHVCFAAIPHSLQSRLDVLVRAHSVNSPSQNCCVPEHPFAIVHARGGRQIGQPVTGHAFSLGGDSLTVPPEAEPELGTTTGATSSGGFFRPSPPQLTRASETTQTNCRCTEPPPVSPRSVLVCKPSRQAGLSTLQSSVTMEMTSDGPKHR